MYEGQQAREIIGKGMAGHPHFGKGKTDLRYLITIVATLTLAINGGAQLPVPAAFTDTGLVAAFVLMTLVALANSYTSDMLLWQALYTGRCDYESLGFAIGGRAWQFFTEVSIVALLYGTLVSGIQQIGETWLSGIYYFEPNPPSWITNGDGRILFVFGTLIMSPAVFLKSMSTLEYCGDVGVVIVIIATIVLIVNCIQHGFPALGDAGEFEISGWSSLSNIVSSVSTFGFIFYIQPIMMPMLEELPPGRRGRRLLSRGTNITILGTAYVIYALTGFFGAARFGAEASEVGNFLQNDLGGGNAQGVLNIAYTVYLLMSMPPFEYAVRHAVDNWVVAVIGDNPRWRWLRKVLLATLLYSSACGLAVAFPGKSAKVITITSATGVCMVSYLIPVVNHYILYFKWSLYERRPDVVANHMRNMPHIEQPDSGLPDTMVPNDSAKPNHGYTVPPTEDNPKLALEPPTQPSPDSPSEETGESEYAWSASRRKGMNIFLIVKELVLPIIVLALGLFSSIATLTTINDE